MTLLPKFLLPVRASQFSLDTPDFVNIVFKRIEYLKKSIPELIGKKAFSDWEAAKEENWNNHLEQYFYYVCDVLEGRQYFKSFGKNAREQMQALQMLYFEFLKEERQRPYLLIESLVKAGCNYPPRYYVYSFDSAGKFSRGLGWETNIDNLFFPSILCYPYVLKPDKVSEFVEPPFSTGSILGIRILQLLAAHSVRVQNKESPSLLSVKEVQEICRILFNYPSDLVKCTIEAYHEFEFLELQNHTFYHNASAALIREMPKLWWVIQEFLYNIAYLNLCSLRAPLSNKVLGGDNPFIRAATLEPRTENVADEDWHQRTVQWVGSKILNSISVYHLLSAINASQCKLANSRLNELDPRLRATVQKAIEGHEGVQGMFDFPKKTKLAIIEQTNAIFDTFNRVSNLEGFLEHYLRGYCSTYLRGEPTTPSQAP